MTGCSPVQPTRLLTCFLIQITKLEFPAANFPLNDGTRHFRSSINSLFQPVRTRCFLLTRGFPFASHVRADVLLPVDSGVPFRFPHAGDLSVTLCQRLRVSAMTIASGKLVMQWLVTIVVGYWSDEWARCLAYCRHVLTHLCGAVGLK